MTESIIEKATGGKSPMETNRGVAPELFEAFTVSETTSIHDKLFVYARPTNQSAYNALVDKPVTVGAIRCEVGGFYSANESRGIPKGTRVLVIKSNAKADNGYILTILGSAVATQNTNKEAVSDNSFSVKSDGGGIHVDGVKPLVSMYTSNNNEVTLTDGDFNAIVGNSKFSITTKAFKLDNGISSFDLQNNATLLTSGEIFIGAGFYSADKVKKDIKMSGAGLNIDVSGGTFETKSKNFKTTQLVRHDEVGSKYSINIGTNLINPNPSFDTTAYDLNVLYGDINLHSTVGNINIHSSNVLQKDSIKITSGLALKKGGFMQGIPPYTEVAVNSLKGFSVESIGAGIHKMGLTPLGFDIKTTGIINTFTPLTTTFGSGLSKITMTPASITLLGGPSPLIEPGVLGITLTQLLTLLITELTTHIHPTAVGPSGPPLTAPVVLPTLLSTLPRIISKGITLN